MKEFKAKIIYKILPTHPDKDYVVGGYDPEKYYEYEDTYKIDIDYFNGLSDVYSYIKRDLRLVAGGGYNDKGIWVFKYVINGKEIWEWS